MDRQAWLDNVEFRGCRAVPCKVHLSPGARREHGRTLADIAAEYPDIQSQQWSDTWDELGERHTAGRRFADSWGCLWENVHDGIVGQPTRFPLADWSALQDFEPPSPAFQTHMGEVDWQEERRLIESGRAEGVLIPGSVDHGFFFQRLYYLRGFNNLMVDIATGDPRLDDLCEMVLEFNRGIVQRYLDIGVDVMVFGDDLGMQDRLPISPRHWRRCVKPAYAELFGMCREAGSHVYLHSDGYIVDIMPDLLECGVTVINPQDLCNGLETIQRLLKGRVCIDLDIDRQRIIPRLSPADVEAHIHRCIELLGAPEGGLMLTCGVYEGTPLENLRALYRAMDRYRHLPAQGGA